MWTVWSSLSQSISSNHFHTLFHAQLERRRQTSNISTSRSFFIVRPAWEVRSNPHGKLRGFMIHRKEVRSKADHIPKVVSLINRFSCFDITPY